MIDYSRFPLKKDVEFSYYWSRAPGKFVNKRTGKEVPLPKDWTGPVFEGTVRDWYELLPETIYDAAIQTEQPLALVPRDSENCFKIFTSRDILTILELSYFYKAVLENDDRYLMGILRSKFDVYVSENVDHNEIIIVNKNNDRVVRVEIKDLV